MKTVCANARLQILSVILCCVGLQHIAQAQQFAPAVNYPTGQYPRSVAVGDFNQDGIPDLVVANEGLAAGTVSILLGNGDGTFRPSREYAAGISPVSVAVGDFNGDGKPDLLVGTLNGHDNIGVLLGNGDGTFMPVVLYSSAATYRNSIAVADFNGDGKLDFVAAGQIVDVPGVSIFLGKGDGTFAPAGDYLTWSLTNSIAVADLNGDGRLDLALAVSDIFSDKVAVLLGRGDGTFQAAVNYPAGLRLAGIASGDFNGDGKLDLVVTSEGASGGGGVSGVAMLIGNGDGTFQAPVIYPTGGDLPDSIAVGDFNSDGKLDVIVADALGSVYLLLGNGDGTFQTPAPYIVGAEPVSVAAADLNSDGLLDVAVANVLSNNVSVLLNVGRSCRAAPDIDHLRARPDTLWPSDRLVDVFIDYHATSDCGGHPACTLAVGSNEPLTQKDYRIIDAHHLKLRAEVSDREEREQSARGEQKHSDQRVYEIQVSCTDQRSNVAHGHTIVTVREDHRRHDDEDQREHHDPDPTSEKKEDSGSTP